MQTLKRILSILIIISLATLVLAGCKGKENVIRIGHKNYSEQRILGQIMSVLIENELGYKTEVTEFGGTSLVFEALKSGDMDIYAEYTGTAYGAVLGESTLKDPQEVYDYVKEVYKKEYNIIWLDPLGYNNTYTFAVLPEIAEKYQLKNFTDLSKVSTELRMVSTTEFLEREDGLPGVQKIYGGFEFKDTRSMDPGLRYAAMKEGQADVMDAFSTDGKLIEYNLVVLADDLSFFPPYYVAPVVNGDFAEKQADVLKVLKKLGNITSESEMQQLNYQVDEKGINEREVAENFLREKGLIK